MLQVKAVWGPSLAFNSNQNWIPRGFCTVCMYALLASISSPAGSAAAAAGRAAGRCGRSSASPLLSQPQELASRRRRLVDLLLKQVFTSTISFSYGMDDGRALLLSLYPPSSPSLFSQIPAAAAYASSQWTGVWSAAPLSFCSDRWSMTLVDSNFEAADPQSARKIIFLLFKCWLIIWVFVAGQF